MGTADTDCFTGIDLAARLGDCSNVLLEAPPFGSTADAACIDLLTVTPPADTHVVNVTLAQPPDDRLKVWQTHAGEQLPAALDVVATEDARQSAVLRDVSARQEVTLTLETVANPTDLTGLSIETTKTVHQPRHGTADTPLCCCFHSVTTLLRCVDLRRAFRFLDVLTTEVRTADAVMHYHLTSDAHDRETRNTLYQLFDLVVQVDADGTVDVHE